jgi:hypothetical protein
MREPPQYHPSSARVHLDVDLERDGMGSGLAASDDPRHRLVDGFDGLFVQVAEVQLGWLKKTVAGFKKIKYIYLWGGGCQSNQSEDDDCSFHLED